ncbi:unnamed protein product [Acanthoscelides obtectus]|uniref:Uncharacterized protein n=1 Tax=Acanthoscelides obtectus TaxID=200917 RepID=A0A9P0QEX6_ACAOB|nr:unnamed protein product [Acanthoscelides obtectus]CAK1622471.1 hypothetical protein AOBTE_LOCUS1506 [Acanthoscelides obtectus]
MSPKKSIIFTNSQSRLRVIEDCLSDCSSAQPSTSYVQAISVLWDQILSEKLDLIVKLITRNELLYQYYDLVSRNFEVEQLKCKLIYYIFTRDVVSVLSGFGYLICSRILTRATELQS